MVSAMKYALVVALIATFACTAYAIKCYQCDSLIDNKCGEKFESTEQNKFDCAHIAPPRWLQSIFPARNATGCMKKVMENIPGHPQVTRTCYFGDISNTQTGCQADPGLPFVKQISCDVCKNDLCNGSSATAPLAIAIVLFFAVARMMS